jgi:hypothetical protein
MNSGGASNCSPVRSIGNMRRSSAKRVQHHGGVFSCLDHFVQVANSHLLRTARVERAVDPLGIAVTNQESAHQICGTQVIVTRHCDQGAPKPGRHVLNKPSFAATCWPLDQQR